MADFGEKADGGLNVIIDALPLVNGILDFKVHKSVCFFDRNYLVHSICWLLDTDNVVLRGTYDSINDSRLSNRSAFAGPPNEEEKERWENRKRGFIDMLERQFGRNDWGVASKRLRR